MNKLGALLVIIGGTVFAYVILTASHGAIRDMVSSANASMSSSNMSNYPGTQPMLLAMPWVLYFIPAVVGIAAVVWLLKFKK